MRRPTLRRKASFLSSSKAALPGGLRLSGEAAGRDSNVDYLIQSYPPAVTARLVPCREMLDCRDGPA
jgi:hypothetical protein